MSQGYKIRLSDGSEVGPMDLNAVRQWFAQGLINADSHVLTPGATRWLRVSEVIPVKASVPAPARPAPSARRTAGFADDGGGAMRLWAPLVLILAAAAGAAYWKLGRAPVASEPIAPAPDPAAADLARSKSLQQQAVGAAILALPHLSASAAQLIMGQSAAEILDPDETFRRACRLVSEGVAVLSREEKAEMGRLTGTAYGALSAKDRARLAAYLDRVRGRRATSPAEDHEMSVLTRRAMQSLPAKHLTRLQALYEKAIRSAVAGGAQA